MFFPNRGPLRSQLDLRTNTSKTYEGLHEKFVSLFCASRFRSNLVFVNNNVLFYKLLG